VTALMAYLVIDWTTRLAILIAIAFRRTASATRAWLPLILLFPIPSLFLFLFFARPIALSRRRRRLAEARQLLENARERISMSRHCSPPALAENLAPSAQLIEHASAFPAVGGNAIEVLPDYEALVEGLVEDIHAASDHVHLTTYIFSDDAVGRQIIAALRSAAQRGVRCRILMDALGSFWWARRVIRKLRACGIEVQRALPISFWDGQSVRPDLRNHRKIAVIDGRVGYIGSQNIIRPEQVDGSRNQEFVVRARGPIVLQLQALFANDWFLETGAALAQDGLFPPDHASGGVHAQLVAGGPEYDGYVFRLLLDAFIHAARERIVITTPYFVPDEALVLALEAAVLRGVSVALVLPEKGDHRMVELAQRSFFERLLQAGADIHLYTDGFLHAKHVSVDGQLCLVGSMNIDLRSLELNAEAGIIVYDKTFAKRVQTQERRNMARSKLLSVAKWRDRPAYTRVAENLARLFSPLL
jgi:cardiolipin synthase A/B